jgi:UDP-N-acetylglucosamine acyltransferase
MGSIVSKDIPPYVMVGGHPAKPHGINAEGLRRRQFSPGQLASIKRAYKILYTAGLTLAAAREEIAAAASANEELRVLADFLDLSERSIIR